MLMSLKRMKYYSALIKIMIQMKLKTIKTFYNLIGLICSINKKFEWFRNKYFII